MNGAHILLRSWLFVPIPRQMIKVKTLTGKEIEIDIEPTDSIERIKERVEEKEGIPPVQQRCVPQISSGAEPTHFFMCYDCFKPTWRHPPPPPPARGGALHYVQRSCAEPYPARRPPPSAAISPVMATNLPSTLSSKRVLQLFKPTSTLRALHSRRAAVPSRLNELTPPVPSTPRRRRQSYPS